MVGCAFVSLGEPAAGAHPLLVVETKEGLTTSGAIRAGVEVCI